MSDIPNDNNKGLITKKYTLKDGSVVEKVYNQKNYNKKYYTNNKDKIKETYMCTHCNKAVGLSNKYNHEMTKTHILKSKYNIDIKNI